MALFHDLGNHYGAYILLLKSVFESSKQNNDAVSNFTSMIQLIVKSLADCNSNYLYIFYRTHYIPNKNYNNCNVIFMENYKYNDNLIYYNFRIKFFKMCFAGLPN